MGHSIAGEELTSLGARGVQRVAGLVYLDAARDNRISEVDPRIVQLVAGFPPPPPSAGSDPAMFRQLYGYSVPEVELRDQEAHPQARAAILAGVIAPDYANIQIPALAIYASFRSPVDVPLYLRTQAPEVLDELFELRTTAFDKELESFRQAQRPKVVLVEGADHFVFLTHEEDVLREVRAFLASLENDRSQITPH